MTTAAVVALSLLGLVMAGAIVLATRVVSFAGTIRHPRAVLQVLWLAALFTLLALVAAAVLFGLVSSTST